MSQANLLDILSEAYARQRIAESPLHRLSAENNNIPRKPPARAETLVPDFSFDSNFMWSEAKHATDKA